jgi:hypothetical protein
MAKIDTLPFNLSGQLGDYVYYKWKGKPVVRKRPSPRKTEPTLGEIQWRSRFGFMMKFLLPLRPLFNVTLKSPRMSPMNMALSVNMNHIIPGSYPGWRVDFSQLLFSIGDIPGAKNLLVNAQGSGQLSFRWNEQSRPKWTNGRDQMYVVAYCEKLKKWLINFGSAHRGDGSLILDLSILTGFKAHVYLGLYSYYGGAWSNSQYLGEIEVV